MDYNFSDTWNVKWLPPNYKEILSKASSPLNVYSFRNIYDKLRRGFLIEGGTQKVWITSRFLLSRNKKVVLVVSAKALDINGVLDSRYWQWVSLNESRFAQAAEAKAVQWFEVFQSIQSTFLNPQTQYSVSFLLKVDRNSIPTCPTPFTFSLKPNGGTSVQSAIYLDDFDRSVPDGFNRVNVKDRGWSEFVFGEVTTDDSGTIDIEVSMKNTDRTFIKKGIIIDGVKITPID